MSKTEFKVPPHSIESEKIILGALLLGWEIDSIERRVGAEDFYEERHKELFKKILEVSEIFEQGGISFFDVCEYVPEEDTQPYRVFLSHLVSMALRVSETETCPIVAYADIVKERALLRKLISVGETIMKEVSLDPRSLCTKEIVDRAEKMIFEAAEMRRCKCRSRS